ncbi:MAG: polymer-forming cytoskeletal protein [Thermoflexaceae bacterium]|nr:polymer-forming cytoskeletal protein [Thermoflexaceae bacterium]
MRRPLLVLIALLAALLPAAAVADDGTAGTDAPGAVFAIDRDYTLPAGDTVGTIVVIGGNAIVEGTVEETLIVIDGTATVNGRVDGDVNVWSGDLVLGAGSQVNNIFLFRSDLTRDGGAVVTGNIDRESGFVLQGWAVLLGILLAIGITVTMLLTGQAVAAIAGQQLAETATTMRTHVGTSILTGVLTVILMPVAAAVFIATIVGIPFGLAMLFVVMPALAVLGFVVAGTWLGSLILHRQGFGTAGYHPYREALVGQLILGAALFVPGLNAATFFVMGTWGVGAIMVRVWQAVRARPAAVAGPDRPAPTTPPAMGTPLAGA